MLSTGFEARDSHAATANHPTPQACAREKDAMDDWHRKLVEELVADTPSGFAPDTATSLEIELGKARSAVAYALEVARAHRVPATGSVTGDDVWLSLGGARARFTLNRREGHVVVARPGHDEVRVCKGGGGEDLGLVARAAIDALVAAWRAQPARKRTPSAPPPEFEDEPTKG
jgi:hypothetical protein